MKEGRKIKRMIGRKEGSKVGRNNRMVGWKEGRKLGREEGRKEDKRGK